MWVAVLLLWAVCGCEENTDCGRLYECRGGMCEHKGVFPLTGWEVAGSGLVMVFLACGLAAGTGGGLMVFPIVLTIFNFSPHSGVPLVNAIAVVGCLVSYLQRCHLHQERTGYPMTDYEIAMIAVSPVTLGVCYGVRLNQIFPQWLLVLLIVVLLGYTVRKTLLL